MAPERKLNKNQFGNNEKLKYCIFVLMTKQRVVFFEQQSYKEIIIKK